SPFGWQALSRRMCALTASAWSPAPTGATCWPVIPTRSTCRTPPSCARIGFHRRAGASDSSRALRISPRRSVHVFRRGAETVVLRGDDVLEGGDVVPGFRLRVAELFDGSAGTPPPR